MIFRAWVFRCWWPRQLWAFTLSWVSHGCSSTSATRSLLRRIATNGLNATIRSVDVCHRPTTLSVSKTLFLIISSKFNIVQLHCWVIFKRVVSRPEISTQTGLCLALRFNRIKESLCWSLSDLEILDNLEENQENEHETLKECQVIVK